MNSARALPGVKALPALAFIFFVLLACSRQANAASIAACNNLDAADTYYLLTQNVSSNFTCFNVTAVNVTLDCQGNVVNYSLNASVIGYGVNASGFINLTVKNCAFNQTNSSGGASVYFYNSNNSAAYNNSINIFGGYGVDIGSSFNNNVTGNVMNGSGGIYLSYSNNSLIDNNTITTSVYGVDMRTVGTCTISNVNITTSLNGSYGIRTGYNSDRVTVINSTITTLSNNLSTGIYLGSSNNLIRNNVINALGYGIQISGPNTTVDNNNITAGKVGIVAWSQSNNTLVKNVTVTVSQTGLCQGIAFNGDLLTTLTNVTLDNNTIIQYCDTALGIALVYVNDGVVNNQKLVGGGVQFAGHAGPSSAVFRNLNVWSNSTYALDYSGFLSLSPNTTLSVVDSVLNSTWGADVFFDGNTKGLLNFLNVTFDKSETIFSPTSAALLNVSWYVDTLVTNGTGNAVDSAAVNITDANVANIFYGLTNSTGQLLRQNVTEYWQNISGIYNFTPHSFAATKSGYQPATNVTDVSLSKLVNVVLGIAVNLSDCGITITTPNSYYTLNRSLYAPGITCITIEAINVTVDCSYYGTIYGITSNNTPNTFGVFSDSKFSNSTIKNCAISNFSSSVNLSGSNAVIYGNTFNRSNSTGFFSGGRDARIYSNTFYGSWNGIQLNGDGALVYNNTIYSVNSLGVLSTYNNLNISYNLIYDVGAVCLYLGAVTDSSIHDNTCFNAVFEGIWFNQGSENNRIYNNRIWNCTNAIAGEFINTSIFNNTFLNITRDTGVTGVASAIYIGNTVGIAGGNAIFNNTIFNNTAGIQLNGSDNNYIYSNNISYNTHANVMFSCRDLMGCGADSDSTGNTLFSNTLTGANYGVIVKGRASNIETNHSINANSISSAGINSIYFIGATNNVVVDSTLSANYAGGANDTVSTLAASNTFVNVTFNKSAVAYEDADSNLTVKWYLGVRVVDQSNNPISNATVNATDVNGTFLFTIATDASGYVVTQNVSEYLQNSTSIRNFTPHLVSARKNPSNSTQTVLSQNNNVVLVLQMPTTLTISNVHIIDVTQNTVTIGWDTNRAANETLDYGLTITYGSTYSNAALAATHSAFITGLTAGTTYHYRVAGCDVYNNCAQTGDYTFDTPDDSGGGGGGGTPTPVATVLPSVEASPAATATVAPSSAPGGSPSPHPAVEKDTVCVAGAVSELEIKRIVTVFEADAALHTLVELIVTNKGSRVLEGVRVSDEIPLALIPSVRFFNAPSSFSGGNATWLAGTLAPGESKKFAYLLPGRVSAGEFKKPVAYGSQLSVSGGLQLFALLIALVILAALVVFILKKRKR